MFCAVLTRTCRGLILNIIAFIPAAGIGIHALAQSPWQWQNPYPHGNTINALYFADPQNGWAVADAGAITHTTNGGTTWELQASGLNGVMRDIHFNSASVGWAVSFNHNGTSLPGKVVRTSNGGETWSQVDLGTSEFWTSVHFSTKNHGWITGGDNIYRTTDGGGTWTSVEVASFFPEDVFFVDERLGWAAGPQGKIYHSDDGGQTWGAQQSGVINHIRAVYFTDAMTGWACGRPGLLLSTTDGGVTWEEVDLPNGLGWFEDIHFADADHGWIATTARRYNGAVLLITEDGGETWDEQVTGSAWEVRTVFYLNATMGWAGGQAGDVRRSDNGGLSWNRQTLGPPDLFYDVAFLNDTFGIAGRSFIESDSFANEGLPVDVRSVVDNANLVTPDGGKTWVTDEFDFICSYFVWKVAKGPDFNNRITWLAKVCGQPYVVAANNLHSLEPHASGYYFEWRIVETGTTEELWGIHVLDTMRWWAVGTNGVIMHTANVGATWEQQHLDSTIMRLDGIYFYDQNLGWAVGTNGVVLRTTDGGESWTPAISNTSMDLRQVIFTSAQNGWAVGVGGSNSLIRSTDGGQTWGVQSYGAFGALYDIVFPDENHGWAVGQGGLIIHTSDGGNTWASQVSPTTNTLLGVDFSSAKKGWATGTYGTIIHFDENITSVEETQYHVPGNFVQSVYPNPTDGIVHIQYAVPSGAYAHIAILDLNGRVIEVVQNSDNVYGSQVAKWDASNTPAGVYLCQFECNGLREFSKIIVAR